MTATILIVDDEPDLVRTVEYALRKEGFRTSIAHDGKTALAQCNRDPLPDLILLDLMLPDISGTEVCRQLRSQERTRELPVVMLTAKDDEIDRVVGFEVGADDYVGKPFSMRVLLLRIKAILRRSDLPPPREKEIRFGVLRIDMQAHRVWVGEEEIILTALEFRLLTTFLERRGRVQTRDTLLHDVWGHVPGLPTRTVDTHVQRLRKKMGAASEYIETLRGVGYRFRTDADEITH
jgi:two-component system phosphate regulon response regulator PhoB